MAKIIFYVCGNYKTPPPKDTSYPCVLLYNDSWNDFGYRTLFQVRLCLEANKEPEKLESVKILQKGLGEKKTRTKLPKSFTELPDQEFCSLGTSMEYYEKIGNLSDPLKNNYLRSLNDLVAHPGLRQNFENEGAFELSLLRDSTARAALERAAPLIHGNKLKELSLKFGYSVKLDGASKEHSVEFDFLKRSGLPHRINVLVGRNATGKTQLLSKLAIAVSGYGKKGSDFNSESDYYYQNEFTQTAFGSFTGVIPPINKVIAISYNPFDKFKTPPESEISQSNANESIGPRESISYKYCGIREGDRLLSDEELFGRFQKSCKECVRSERRELLKGYLGKLLTANVIKLLANGSMSKKEYDSLSAGQRIITAIVSQIVSFIEDGSLLLIDEPETHLHPGLLSSVILIFQEILEDYCSYAVIATHSPLILQQVPARYVHILSRDGTITNTKKMRTESFGEELGTLYENVFGLAEPELDYHDFLDKLYNDGHSFNEIESMFGNKLSLNVRMYLQSLFVNGLESDK